MGVQLSRRAFIGAVGGGLLAIASASIWKGACRLNRGPGEAIPAESQTYADFDGWIVTADDKQRMARSQLFAPKTP